MKFIKLLLIAIMLLIISVIGAFAATKNPATGAPGYNQVVIPIMGVYSSNETVVKWKSPTGYRLMHASVSARAVVGTNPTLTVDVQSGGTSLFTTPVSVSTTPATITDAVLSASPLITDESTVSIIFAKGGSYTSGQGWKSPTVFLFLKQL